MNIHNTVDTILYHTVDCNYNTLATGHQYNTKLLCFCHTPPSGHIHPYAGSGSILMLLMLTQRSDIASYCIATCDRTKAVANQLSGGLFKPRNQLLALGSIFAVLSVNYNDDIWQCGNGRDQR